MFLAVRISCLRSAAADVTSFFPTTAEITAAPSAPAEMTETTFSLVMPPIAMSGMVQASRILLRFLRPFGAPASLLDDVVKTGLKAR